MNENERKTGPRPMSPEKQAEYDRLTRNCYQMQMNIAALEAEPQVYGYARVSTQGQARDGNSLADQTEALTAAGAVKVYSDAYTGWEKERPGLDELLSVLREGDTVVVTKLDRMARSTVNGLQLIQELTERGVTVNVLNIGPLSKKPEDKVRLTILLAFAEYERDMIMQRTRAGKEIARQRPGYHEGRKPKWTTEQLDHAITLLPTNSYRQIERMTGISKSTLIRAARARGIRKNTENK